MGRPPRAHTRSSRGGLPLGAPAELCPGEIAPPPPLRPAPPDAAQSEPRLRVPLSLQWLPHCLVWFAYLPHPLGFGESTLKKKKSDGLLAMLPGTFFLKALCKFLLISSKPAECGGYTTLLHPWLTERHGHPIRTRYAQ